jgi:hypothetical protein
MNERALQDISMNIHLSVPEVPTRHSLIEGYASPMKDLSRCSSFTASRFCHNGCTKCKK